MDTVSLRTKRPREGPADTGLSAAHGRSKAKSANAETRSDDEEYAKSESSEEPESSNDEEDEEPESSSDEEDEESESSSDEEDSQSEASVETESPAVTKLDWSDRTPAEPLTIEVRIPRRTWAWLQTWTLKDVKKMRPCDKKWKMVSVYGAVQWVPMGKEMDPLVCEEVRVDIERVSKR